MERERKREREQRCIDRHCWFRAMGFFNEADTLESSSIRIYSQLQTWLYAQSGQRDAALIKT